VSYFWVYIPDVDEAGCVVHAPDFEDAFRQGIETLLPDAGVELQAHVLGESQTHIVEEASMIDE
jgi:hypothetical protein